MTPDQARAVRAAAGLTIQRLAALMRVDRRTVMRWEGGSGTVAIPGPAQVLYQLLERDQLPPEVYAPAEGGVVDADQPSAPAGSTHVRAAAQRSG